MSTFTVYPAIELRGGMGLRYESVGMGTRANRVDAVKLAKEFEAAGATFIHVFNLDGPFLLGESEHQGSVLAGANKNLDVITEMAKAVKTPLQFGGGLRDINSVMKVLSLGIKRVALGNAAMRNPDLVRNAVKLNAESIVAAIDGKNGMCVSQEWVKVKEMRVEELARHMKTAGVKHFIYQDVQSDALGQGPAIEGAKRIGELGVNVIAAGGVTELEHIKACAKTAGIGGVLVGKAFAQGKFTYKQAVEAAENGLKERK
jgi:phosphoribosylformimino-5-aminoimidazole carboxamide ribotide isomerase